MTAFWVVLLSIVAGMVAGAIAARRTVRKEVEELRALIRARIPEPVAAPPPLPDGRGSEVVEAPPPEPEEISPEMLMVLSAAVAAFLGKKARIRRASLMPPVAASSWAQQGRVFVQASHNLAVHHR